MISTCPVKVVFSIQKPSSSEGHGFALRMWYLIKGQRAAPTANKLTFVRTPQAYSWVQYKRRTWICRQLFCSGRGYADNRAISSSEWLHIQSASYAFYWAAPLIAAFHQLNRNWSIMSAAAKDDPSTILPTLTVYPLRLPNVVLQTMILTAFPHRSLFNQNARPAMPMAKQT